MNRNHWTKIYLLILSIVTAVLVCVGIGIHVFDAVRYIPGIRTKISTIHIEDIGSTVSDSIAVDGSDVSSLDIACSVADLHIVMGSEFAVSYNIPERLAPVVKVENGTLYINQPNEVNVSLGSIGSDYGITVTVPSELKMKDININVDMGNVEIRDAFELSGDLIVEVDMGNVDAWNVTSQNMTVNVDMGNATVRDCKCDVLSSNVDMGDVDVNSYFNSIVANCSLGDIDIYSQNKDARVDANTDLGGQTVKWAD